MKKFLSKVAITLGVILGCLISYETRCKADNTNVITKDTKEVYLYAPETVNEYSNTQVVHYSPASYTVTSIVDGIIKNEVIDNGNSEIIMFYDPYDALRFTANDRMLTRILDNEKVVSFNTEKISTYGTIKGSIKVFGDGSSKNSMIATIYVTTTNYGVGAMETNISVYKQGVQKGKLTIKNYVKYNIYDKKTNTLIHVYRPIDYTKDYPKSEEKDNNTYNKVIFNGKKTDTYLKPFKLTTASEVYEQGSTTPEEFLTGYIIEGMKKCADNNFTPINNTLITEIPVIKYSEIKSENTLEQYYILETRAAQTEYKFDANGGKFDEGIETTFKVDYGNYVKLPLKVPTREGYKFLGYYGSTNNNDEKINGYEKNDCSADRSKTYFAHWAKLDDEYSVEVTYGSETKTVTKTFKITEYISCTNDIDSLFGISKETYTKYSWGNEKCQERYGNQICSLAISDLVKYAENKKIKITVKTKNPNEHNLVIYMTASDKCIISREAMSNPYVISLLTQGEYSNILSKCPNSLSFTLISEEDYNNKRYTSQTTQWDANKDLNLYVNYETKRNAYSYNIDLLEEKDAKSGTMSISAIPTVLGFTISVGQTYGTQKDVTYTVASVDQRLNNIKPFRYTESIYSGVAVGNRKFNNCFVINTYKRSKYIQAVNYTVGSSYETVLTKLN